MTKRRIEYDPEFECFCEIIEDGNQKIRFRRVPMSREYARLWADLVIQDIESYEARIKDAKSKAIGDYR